MLPSKFMRTRMLDLGPIKGTASTLPAKLCVPSSAVNTLALAVTHPGLPSWWRLAAPTLDWIHTFTKQVAWAVFLINPSPSFPVGGSLKLDWTAPRGRLLTLTRGPMARKKKSRIQFLLTRKPTVITVTSRTKAGLQLDPRSLKRDLGYTMGEESFWSSALPAPLSVLKSKSTTTITGPGFLLWR